MVTSTPDANGAFTAVFVVPLGVDATSQITAVDTKANNAGAVIFTLMKAEASLTPASGPVGTVITITASGFAPFTQVNSLGFGDAPGAPFPMVVTDGQGGFTADVLVPGLATGAQTVTVGVGDEDVTLFFVIEAALPSVASVTAGISDELVIVWGYIDGEWLFYDPADPGSDLDNLTSGVGYWVKVSADCTLVYGGYSYVLKEGWNNIGWR
jgi:hypothetical protein